MKGSIGLFGVLAVSAALCIGCSGSSKGGNTPASSSSKAMSSFEIISPVAAAGVIDESVKTVAVTVPYGSSVTTLVANFETTGVKTTIGDVEQISSTTPNDFTNPVNYTVVAQDGSTAAYTVTITTAKSSDNDITKFTILGNDGVISGTDISVAVPFGTDRSSLAPTIVVSGSSVSPASGSLQNFTNVVIYTVTAADGSTKNYSITVKIAIRTSITGTGLAAKTAYTLPSGTAFSEIQATADSLSSSITFPMGTDDASTGTISTPFVIAETDVTYQLWKEVYDWATTSARGTAVYSFANAGQNGTDGSSSYSGFDTTVSTQYPVTKVNWRDAIVWCNALTEYYNANNGTGTDLAVVYYSDSGYTTPIRTSTSSETITYTTAGTQDAPYVNSAAKGFRLPTSVESEFAARYIGTSTSNTNVVLKDGVYYTNGVSASGATATYTSDAATLAVAVFGNFSSGTSTGVTGTAVVKSKTANALGLYDMSGNVFRWNFDWRAGYTGYVRVFCGGSFANSANYTQVGKVSNNYPYYAGYHIGFRPVRNK